MSKPKVIKAGKDPDCIHHEHIDGELIGTCCKCGQVKNYRSVWASDTEPSLMKSRGDATLEQVQQSRSKGGQQGKQAKNASRGSSNENSAAWAGINRPPGARRSSELPVLIRGDDF